MSAPPAPASSPGSGHEPGTPALQPISSSVSTVDAGHADARPAADIDTAGGPPAGMSKNQWKKQLRFEKAQAEKKARRAAEKARRKANKRARYQEMQAKIESGEMEPPAPKRPKVAPPKRPVDVGVIIDLGFDSLMEDRERRSMCLQLGHLYSTQRHSSRPFRYLYYVGEGAHPGRAYVHSASPDPEPEDYVPESLVDTALGTHMEKNWEAMWRRWKGLGVLPCGGIEALLEDGPASELEFLEPMEAEGKRAPPPSHDLRTRRWKKQDLVYLTADATETANTLEEGKAYIVGGIVDHNRYKNLCANKARDLGIRTMRLPINAQTLRLADGAELASRKVLTVNQVFDILSGWAETQDWSQALARAFPVRKFKEVIHPSDRVKNGTARPAAELAFEPNEDLAPDAAEVDKKQETAAIQQAAADAESDDDAQFNA